MISNVVWSLFSCHCFCFMLIYKLEALTQAGNSICKILTQLYGRILYIHMLGNAVKNPLRTLLYHWNYFLMLHVWLCWNVNHQQPENNSKQGQLMLSALTAHVHRFHGRKHTRLRKKKITCPGQHFWSCSAGERKTNFKVNFSQQAVDQPV